MAVYTDPFEGTALVDLPVYNTIWQTGAGGNPCEISSDGHSYQATVIDGNPNGNYYNDTFADRHYSMGLITASPTGDAGVTIRHQSASKDHFYAIWVTSLSQIFVGEYISGTPTDWAGGTNIAGFAAGDYLKLEVDAANSTTINLIRIRAATPTVMATFTGKSALTLGKAGVCAFLGSSATIESWEGGDTPLANSGNLQSWQAKGAMGVQVVM